MIKAVLFDLDGTLLPMDQDYFISEYMKGLALKMSEYGYEPESFTKAMWAGVKGVYKNDGSLLNEERFWEECERALQRRVRDDEQYFNEFYETEFQKYREICGFNPAAKPTVDQIRSMGYRVALATNPFFPMIATESRTRWAGFEPTDFEFITTFENSYSCKPNPRYYLEVANKLGLSPEECLMVGNDVRDDMIAETVGMKVFLLTDCLINIKEADITGYPKGNLDDLLAFIKSL